MKIDDFATWILPEVKAGIAAEEAAIKADLGHLWLVIHPFWNIITGPLLPHLVRIGANVAVKKVAPVATPYLASANELISSTK